MGFYDDSPGYKNPLGSNSPSWGSGSDWNGSGGGIDWKGGFNVDKSGLWDKSFGRYNNPAESYLNLTKNKLLDKATQKRNNQDSSWSSSGWSQGGGGGVSAYSGEVLPGYGVYESGKLPPLVIHPPQKKGMFGDIGGLAGGIGTALGVFGPLGMPIGAAIGGIADQF